MTADKQGAEQLAKGLGLDDAGIVGRRRIFGIAEGDPALARIQKVVQDAAPGLTDALFEHLVKFSLTPLAKPKVLEGARRLQQTHLVATVQGKYGVPYARECLELACIYESGQVDIAALNGAFRHMGDLALERITAAGLKPGDAQASCMAFNKVLAFDVSLLTEAIVYLRENAIRRTGEESTQYARSLIEVSLDPLVTISPEGKITDVNEGSVKATGVERDQLIGTDFSSYFTEPAKAQEGHRQVFAKGLITDYPLTLRHKSGKLTDVLYNASVYKDVNGVVLGIFSAARDITAQKQASQYARSLLEASLDPLVTISPTGKITDVNEGTVKVTGMPREKLIGSSFRDYFTDPAKAQDSYEQVFAKGSINEYPLTFRHVDGKLTDVLYNGSVYKDTNGNVLGVVSSARDVTLQKAVEAELAEQRTREMNRLAELERFNRLTVGRELKMIELKKEIAELQNQVRASA